MLYRLYAYHEWKYNKTDNSYANLVNKDGLRRKVEQRNVWAKKKLTYKCEL